MLLGEELSRQKSQNMFECSRNSMEDSVTRTGSARKRVWVADVREVIGLDHRPSL